MDYNFVAQKNNSVYMYSFTYMHDEVSQCINFIRCKWGGGGAFLHSEDVDNSTGKRWTDEDYYIMYYSN